MGDLLSPLVSRKLQQALAPQFTPLTKIRLADVLRVQRGLSVQCRSAAFNRVSSKHADFVLCASDTFRVVGVVELDDKSHRGEARQQRDKFLDNPLAAAGIPVSHITAPRSYSVADICTLALASLRERRYCEQRERLTIHLR